MIRKLPTYATQLTFWLSVTAAVSFLLIPAILVVLLSFSADPAIQFPPSSWGNVHYEKLLIDHSWGEATALSIKIALIAGVLSVFIAVPAVIGIHRGSAPGGANLELFAIAPLLVPQAAYAVGIYLVIAQFGMLGTMTGLVLANLVICFPFVFIIVSSHIAQIPKELELVAMTLGAPRWRASIGITLRLMTPAVLSGFLFAFMASFDEAVFINFINGPSLVTLPKLIFDSVRLGVDPVITAISALLMLGTAVVTAVAYAARAASRYSSAKVKS